MSKKKLLILTPLLISTTVIAGCKATPIEIPEITVTFDYNGSGEEPLVNKIQKGGFATCPGETPTWENHVFKGWRVSKESTSDFFQFDERLYKNTTIYASWEEKSTKTQYTVTFNENYGETPKTTTKKVYEGGVVDIPTTPTRDKYIFEKWKTGSDSSSSDFDFSTKIYSDMTLYASWKHDINNLKIDGEKNIEITTKECRYSLLDDAGGQIPEEEVSWKLEDQKEGIASIDSKTGVLTLTNAEGGIINIIATYRNRTITIEACVADFGILNLETLENGKYILKDSATIPEHIWLPEKYYKNDNVYSSFKISDSCFKNQKSILSINVPSTCNCVGVKPFENCNNGLVAYFNEDKYVWKDNDENKTYVNNPTYNGQQFATNEKEFTQTVEEVVMPTKIEMSLFAKYLTVGQTYHINPVYTPSNTTFKDVTIELDDTLKDNCELKQDGNKYCLFVKSNPNLEKPFTMTVKSKVDGDIKCEKKLYINAPTSLDKFMFTTSELGEGCVKIERKELNKSLTTQLRIPSVDSDGQTVVEIGKMYKYDEEIWYYEDTTDVVELVIPDTVIKIDDDAFQRYTALNNVHFGNNLKTIGKRAFTHQNIAGYSGQALSKGTLYLPSSLEEIGEEAFKFEKIITTEDKSFTKVIFEDGTKDDTWTLSYTGENEEEVIYKDNYAPSENPEEAATILKGAVKIDGENRFLRWKKNVASK